MYEDWKSWVLFQNCCCSTSYASSTYVKQGGCYLPYRSAFIKLICYPKQDLQNPVRDTSISFHNLKKNVFSNIYLGKAVLHRSGCIKNPLVFSDSEERTGIGGGEIQPVTLVCPAMLSLPA